MTECGFCRGWTSKNGIKVCLRDRYLLYQYKWSRDRGYVRVGNGGIYLHRMIIPNYEIIHHINGNKLDNRRCNLEGMTISKHCRLHNKGLWGGVHFRKDRNPEKKCWRFQIRYNNKRINFGPYEDPITAYIIREIIEEELK